MELSEPGNAPPCAPDWLVLGGAGGFIAVLAVSAWWEADIRWLHFFQSAMYVFAIALVLRKNRWGYLVGIAAAGFWNYANVFGTSFFYNGLQQISGWFRTGHARADLLIAVPAWFSNLLVVIGGCWGYARLARKSAGDPVRFLVALVLTTGYFAADMAVFQPRYLGIFPRLLHPQVADLTRFLTGR